MEPVAEPVLKEIIVMRGITNCCDGVGVYITPWCEMIGGNGENQTNALHLYYKLDWLQKEIEKRSSYLGKFRRTEEAKHLLDLIAMTKDEEDLFYPFAKAAMADVFDAIHQYAPKTQKSYLWREGKETVEFDELPTLTEEDVEIDVVSRAVSDDTIYVYDEIIFPEDVRRKRNLYNIVARVALEYEVYYTILETGTEITETRVDYVYHDDDSIESITHNPQLAPAGAETSAEHVSRLVSVKYDTFIFTYKEPATFKVGDYVQVSDKLYMAIEDGDANGWFDKVVETEDFRDSIHYILAFRNSWNPNFADPLDTAIFEALVARIIYKWLQYAYPDEAERYQTEWLELMRQIKRRCDELWSQKIVSRIPRVY